MDMTLTLLNNTTNVLLLELTGQSLSTITTIGLLANVPAPLYSAVSPEAAGSMALQSNSLAASVITGGVSTPLQTMPALQQLHNTINIDSSVINTTTANDDTSVTTSNDTSMSSL